MESTDLKKAGLKATLPRLKVLDVLEKSGRRHMSAEDVYKALIGTEEDVGLATVYRVLTQFEAAGLVIRHHFEEGHALFELDSGEHHDHIICVQCGKIIEFLDATIEARQHRIAKKHGFAIGDHSLVIYGQCTTPNCQGCAPGDRRVAPSGPHARPMALALSRSSTARGTKKHKQ